MILRCEECRALVTTTVVASYRASHEFAPTVQFSFCRCPKCNAPFLVIQEEDFPDGWREPQRLFPVEEESLGYDVPETIRAAFEEAVRCMGAGAHTASAIMCRKVTEGVCVAHGVKNRTLAASLKSLAEKGVLESRMLEWADELRLYGNDAAHDVDVQISHQEAEDLLGFTRALVEYVFTFQKRFDEFKQRRVDRKA